MTVSFEEALEIARIVAAEEFRELGHAGTYYASPGGYDGGTFWLIVDGAREDLVDGDPDYRIMDKPVTIVDKSSGALSYLEPLDVLERIGEYPPVGTWGD